ncbi:MAG: hypothetical protein QM477_10955 [Planctomycetota bacterium]
MQNRRLALLSTLFLGIVACGNPGDNVEISDKRVADWVPQYSKHALTPEQRFGTEPLPSEKQQQADPQGDSLLYDLPDGWTLETPTSMRLVNLHPGGHADADCYVSVLGGNGGGLAANFNRWRKQVGLDPMQESELISLPTIKLLGGDASLLQIEGNYTGMGNDAQADWGLTGAMVSTDQATIFVKMTGPSALLHTEHERFLAFVSSLHFGQGSDAQQAPVAEPEKPAANGESFLANGFRFRLPEGWSDAGPRSMRTLNLRVGDNSECYLVVLGGAGGGIAPNINRWQTQLGLDPLTNADIDALPRVPFLGSPSHFLEANGDFTGMSGESLGEQTLLGIAKLGDGSAFFLKMVGPVEEVARHREAFLAFAASLEEVQ